MLDTLTSDSPIHSLAAELQRQLATKRDLIADTRRVSFAEYDAGWARGEGPAEPVRSGLSLQVDLPDRVKAYTVTDHAHDQIGGHLGIHAKLYDRLLGNHPDLLANLANGLFSREPTEQMIRTMDGKARAFLSNKYRPRDNWDLLDKAILPALEAHPGLVEFKRCDLTDTKLYVKIVLPEFERPITPNVGDVIRGGLIVQNSEVGAGALVIAPYTDELACRNGMVHTRLGQRRIHVGKRIDASEEAFEFYSDETVRLDDEAFFAKCRDTVRAVLNETVFDAIVSKIHELREIVVADAPPKAVEVLAGRHDFNEAETGSILRALTEGGDLSALGYVRAITTTARDLADPDRQTEMEALAGAMVDDPALVVVR